MLHHWAIFKKPLQAIFNNAGLSLSPVARSLYYLKRGVGLFRTMITEKRVCGLSLPFLHHQGWTELRDGKTTNSHRR